MSDLCREFGVSRPTGYKFWNRFRELGPEGLGDFSRRPYGNPNRTPEDIQRLVIEARMLHSTWGPRKLKAFLRRQHPGVPIPAASTIGELLKRKGLVRPRRKRRKAKPTPCDRLTAAEAPNDVWCADFKGQFRLQNRRYCYPLTITDLHSRFLIGCDSLDSTRMGGAFSTFIHAFKTYGLPKVIRTDNGSPFASTGLAGLTQLSVWWMRLGIRPERIQPGHPEQNGAHERMHLTLKQDTTRPPGNTLLHQQERFDKFRTTYNEVRPHEALKMDRPADHYRCASDRPYRAVLESPHYPLHDQIKRVSRCGHITFTHGWAPYISTSLAGEHVGLREIEEGRWLVHFLHQTLGEIREQERRFIPCHHDNSAMNHGKKV
jgi:putative transposase|tara:strand:- start:47 stop:1171 length:1125 start_codon:yes stop_codon:yes gene_type:complete